jgi:HEPN domain-containing protein
MTQAEYPSGPQEWLRHARSNLKIAESGRRFKGVLLEDLCFNAQQAAEKASRLSASSAGLTSRKHTRWCV